MVARSEHGEQVRASEKVRDKRSVTSKPSAVLRRPASWAEVDEYLRWRASKAANAEHVDEG